MPEPSALAVPSTVVPLVSYSVTAALASAVPVNVGVVSLVRLSVLEAPESEALVRSGAEGALILVSMVRTSAAEAAVLGAVIVKLWMPAANTPVVKLQ